MEHKIKIEVTDEDIVDLLTVTLHDMISIGARYADGKFKMRVGPIIAEVTREEVMELRFDPHEFFKLVQTRIQEQIKTV